MDAAEIKIDRDRNLWVDRARAYKVLIDGEIAGEIRHGESRSFNVPPGRHQLRLKIDWAMSKSMDIDLPSGAQATIRCGPARPFLLGQLLGTLKISPYIRVGTADLSEH
jgi:hypothetical protein